MPPFFQHIPPIRRHSLQVRGPHRQRVRNQAEAGDHSTSQRQAIFFSTYFFEDNKIEQTLQGKGFFHPFLNPEGVSIGQKASNGYYWSTVWQ